MMMMMIEYIPRSVSQGHDSVEAQEKTFCESVTEHARRVLGVVIRISGDHVGC